MISKKKKIYIASDHAGFELKKQIINFLIELNFEIFDEGAFSYNKDDDYPDFISKVAEKISLDKEGNLLGIILGGSGQGESIVANRFKGVRSVVYYGGNDDILKLSREHNNANILSLGARFLSEDETKKAVKLWLETSFSDEERHKRRIQKIDNLI